MASIFKVRGLYQLKNNENRIVFTSKEIKLERTKYVQLLKDEKHHPIRNQTQILALILSSGKRPNLKILTKLHNKIYDTGQTPTNGLNQPSHCFQR